MYFLLHKDKQGGWLWTLRDAQHVSISSSSRSFSSREIALHSISVMRTGTRQALTYDQTTETWL